jgi:hypothetical protein
MKNLILFLFVLHCAIISVLAQKDWEKLNQQWTNCYSSALSVKGASIFLGTSSCGLFISSDSGRTFPVNVPNSTIVWSGSITGIYRSGNIIIAGKDGTKGIFKSTDNGSTWNNIASATEPKGADYLMYDGTNLYATYQTGIFKMPINGTTWTKLKTMNTARLLAVKGSKMVALFHPCYLTVSNDGGATWSQDYMLPENCNTQHDCIAISGNNILVGGNHDGIYLSSDDCKTWTKITAGLNNVSETYDFIEVNNKLYAATSYGAKVSTDNGVTWSAFGTYTLQPMCFTYESPYLYAGCPSYVYRIKAGSGTGIDDSERGNGNILKINPNPVNESSVITYYLPANSYIRISVYDILGRQIEKFADEYQDKGEHNITFSADKLNEGIYIIALNAGYTSAKAKLAVKR